MNSNEGLPASREVMSAANTIDDQEESDGAVIEVNGELEEGEKGKKNWHGRAL